MVNIHAAKTQLSRLIDMVCSGEEVVIARGSEPVVKLIPIEKVQAKRQPGALKGQLAIPDDFFDPLPPDELDAWEGTAPPDPANVVFSDHPDATIIRVPHTALSADLRRLHDYALLRLTQSKSQLTGAEAAEIAKEVDQAVWERVRHLYEEP
jgi:prevent-host-death family protein